jgi:hypothetical protein
VFLVSTSAAVPPLAADAPLASDKDNPAAPNTGTALLLRFRLEACFACDMVESSETVVQMFDQSTVWSKCVVCLMPVGHPFSQNVVFGRILVVYPFVPVHQTVTERLLGTFNVRPRLAAESVSFFAPKIDLQQMPVFIVAGAVVPVFMDYFHS